MSIPANVQKLLPFGYKTENAATIIQLNVPGLTGFRAALLNLVYTAAATAHTISLLFPATTAYGKAPAAATLAGSKNTAASAAAAGQAVINVTSAPKDPAGNATASGDIIAYECTDGTWEFNTVSSLDTLAITCGTNLAKAVAAGAKVRILGIAADGYVMQLAAGANATKEFHNYGNILLAHPDVGEPCVIQSNNATNAGFILNALVAYINK